MPRRGAVVALFGLFVAAAGCSVATADSVAQLGLGGHRASVATIEALRPAGWRIDRVVLVTVDGVRWQDIAAALDGRAGVPLPGLRRLAARGVAIVDEMHTSAPYPVSLPGYREILTGRRGGECIDNRCPPIDEPTLLDELAAAGRAPGEVAEVASWEGLALAAAANPERVVVSAGRHGGATRERLAVDDAAARRLAAAAARHDYSEQHADYRRDEDTMALALTYLATARPRFLHVALGDTDVHAHAGNWGGYLVALAAADEFVTRVGAVLDELGGDSLLLVTTDHGRAPSFRDHGGVADGSARVWLIAAGAPIATRGRVQPGAPHRLADVTPSLRTLLALPADDDARAGRAIPELIAEN
jgi:hypothetical protein